MLSTIAVYLAAGLWLALLLAPWQYWRVREHLPAASAAGDIASTGTGAGIAVLIPARNEAAVIARTLAALHAHPQLDDILVVDDRSSDATAAVVRQAARADPRIHLIVGEPLPKGWSGKLWALHQGLAHTWHPTLLLLDADIQLRAGMVHALHRKMQGNGLALISVMATLRMQRFWERLLMPAFIYFFRLLYPFALSNRPRAPVAAAAGGCILVRRDALAAIGGFAAIKDALIDDCTLAAKVKQLGVGGTWLGLSRDVLSLREAPALADSWAMVSRTAFTQLRYSAALLLLCTVGLSLMFVLPVVAPLYLNGPQLLAALAAFAMMSVSYWPLLRYYELPAMLALTLPIAALLFTLMTWHSAIRYWRGTRSAWKGRQYESQTGDW